MSAYYNEIDPFTVLWLRELIRVGVIADGVVDNRSIVDVDATDVKGFTQCHFFAGIGGWSYALRLAGWSDNRPVWTGSAPCQPFSTAGNQKGKDDDRHLAPHWLNLIKECRPPVIYGEQVAAAIRHGWVDDLQDALGGEGYTSGFSVQPACGLGSPHIRQRLWFYAARMGNSKCHGQHEELQSGGEEEERWMCEPQGSGSISRLANTERTRWEQRAYQGRVGRELSESVEAGGALRDEPCDGGTVCRLADTESKRSAGIIRDTSEEKRADDRASRKQGEDGVDTCGSESNSDTHAPLREWDVVDRLFCRDGKWRPVEPGAFPLVNGLPKHMGRGSGIGMEIDMHPAEAKAQRLKGYGNAIIPQVAAEVIKAMIEYQACQT